VRNALGARSGDFAELPEPRRIVPAALTEGAVPVLTERWIRVHEVVA